MDLKFQVLFIVFLCFLYEGNPYFNALLKTKQNKKHHVRKLQKVINATLCNTVTFSRKMEKFKRHK